MGMFQPANNWASKKRNKQTMKTLNGKIAENARKELKSIVDKECTKYKIWKGCAVNIATIDRFLAGGNVTVDQLDKIGNYIKILKDETR